MSAKRASHSLFSELVLLTVSVLLVAVLSVAWYTNSTFTENTQAQYLRALETIAEKKSGEIAIHIDEHLNRIKAMAHMDSTRLAISQLEASYQQGVNSQAYADNMARFKNSLDEQRSHWGYYDLFLIGTNGEIIYSSKHESDFATNLNSGPYKDSQLAKVFRDAMLMLQVSNSTFEHYPPSDAPAAFIAVPVLGKERILGVLALQFDTEAFYRVINDLSGLGATGETVVGKLMDGHVQITAPLRHDPDAAFKRVLAIDSPEGKPTLQAARGDSGTGFHTDWRGVKVAAAWQYIPSMQWGMVVKIDEAEAFASLYRTQNNILLFTLIGLFLAYLAAVFVARHITLPLVELGKTCSSFSAGERSIRIDTSTVPQRELFDLAEGFNQMAGQIERSENSLISDRERLAVAVDQSQEGILITDPDTVIQYANHAFTLISGYSIEESVGQKTNLVKSGKMSDEFYKAMWAQISSGKVWRSEFINRNKSGALYTIDQTISPILDKNREITGYTSLQHDITEKKNEEKRIEHSQRLESLGVLAGGIAHDFNNLLTVILGNATLALAHIKPASPAAKMLVSIEEASEQAADLCRQMLAYSGKGMFVVKPINLSLMIEEMLNLLKVSIGKNVTINLNLERDIPSIQADATQMQQIIMNLIINASEAIGEERGIITIRTGSMHADQEYFASLVVAHTMSEGEYVFLEISDNGCGMTEEVRSKIFDPFFTTKFTGRGLGMSAILGIVRGHKGTITIYSEPGQGSTFKLLFPASDVGRHTRLAAPPQEQEWQASGVVLIVDDEITLQKTSRAMLENMGFEVMVANDGVEGVEMFRANHEKITAVLLDMTMPRMNGEEAFRQMRKIDPGVKVILNSGYNQQDATSLFAGKGLAGFLQKPYTYKSLKAKLMEILGVTPPG